MIALIAHAIVRHRLMNMRVVIRKGTVYCVAFAVAGAVLAASIYAADTLFGAAQFGLMSHILLGLTVGVVFHPLKTLIQTLFDRYLYRTQYHYQSTLKAASEVIASRLRLQALLAYLADVIQRTMRNEWLAVYLKDESSARGYTLQSSAANSASGKVQPPAEIRAVDPIPTALATQRTILSADAKRADAKSAHAKSADASSADAVASELSRLGADLAIPLLDETGLIGFVVLGAKLSGDPYFPDDLDLLATVAHQAEVAIKNVQLYRQVVRINEHLQNIVTTIESGVIAVDAGGRITLFNRTAEQMIGLDRERARRLSAAGLPSAMGEPLLATLRDGQQRVIPEAELARADGGVLPVICVTSPLREPTGEFLGAVAVFSDLTPLKELEMERRRAERLAYFEQMAAGFAHEIKNPLVAIKTFMQLLPRRGHQEHFRESFGQVASREITRMERLLERLRALAKPGSRPQHVLDVGVPVTDAIEILQARFDENRITVRWQPGPTPCWIMGDREELEQLFLNLFINALEAMPPGGTLTVTIRKRDGCSVVDVEDTGPGIPEEVLTRMFDPFVTTKLRGSGLGLAICASVADSHRATIRAHNKSGSAGAVFSVEFPTGAQVPTLRTA
jgi:PAS domain S-box-containing protein